jgi:hypothetical protein
MNEYISTVDLLKRVPRQRVTIDGKRKTYLRHYNETTDKNIRYIIRVKLLRMFGYIA